MIHKAFCSVLATGALLLVGPAAHAATFELIDNGTTYDAVVTQEAGDSLIFAVDMFIQASQGATLTVANNNSNPFDQATGNDNPPGNPDAILIGGSDISGTCDNSSNSCFGDFSCGGGTCVFGRAGSIKLGEVNWDGNGTVSLRNNSQAVDGSLNEIPHTNVSGCQLINGEEVLAGDDNNGNGIVRGCECGDANNTGAHEAADLFLIFNCQLSDSQGETEPCATTIHNGDGQNSGAFEAADLFVTFNSQVDPSSAAALGSTCAARPNPVTP